MIDFKKKYFKYKIKYFTFKNKINKYCDCKNNININFDNNFCHEKKCINIEYIPKYLKYKIKYLLLKNNRYCNCDNNYLKKLFYSFLF
jgi:hypothetical protein